MNDMHLALHGVAIKKHAAAAAVADAVGLSAGRAGALLAEATAGGRLAEAQGGYVLTPAGRMILDNQYSRFYGELRADEAFVTAYDRFERVNVGHGEVIESDRKAKLRAAPEAGGIDCMTHRRGRVWPHSHPTAIARSIGTL